MAATSASSANNQPVRPASTSSRVPPLSFAITGIPAAIASSTALGEPWCVPSTIVAVNASSRYVSDGIAPRK